MNWGLSSTGHAPRAAVAHTTGRLVPTSGSAELRPRIRPVRASETVRTASALKRALLEPDDIAEAVAHSVADLEVGNRGAAQGSVVRERARRDGPSGRQSLVVSIVSGAGRAEVSSAVTSASGVRRGRAWARPVSPSEGRCRAGGAQRAPGDAWAAGPADRCAERDRLHPTAPHQPHRPGCAATGPVARRAGSLSADPDVRRPQGCISIVDMLGRSTSIIEMGTMMRVMTKQSAGR